jgi:YesN/AraC family two-component response regulator
MIRILLADDHKIVRDGLKRILAAHGDLRGRGEAASGDQALALVQAHDYDVAMLDMSMPGLSGIDLIKRLKTRSRSCSCWCCRCTASTSTPRAR